MVPKRVLKDLFSSKSVVIIYQLSCFSLFLEFLEILMLITILGNYIICLYLFYFDNRIWENRHYIIVSYIFDGIFLGDLILRLMKCVILRQNQFQPIDVRRPRGCNKPWELLRRTVDIFSCIPLEIFLWITPLSQYQPEFSINERDKYKLYLFAALRINRIMRIHRAVEYYLEQTYTRKPNLYRRQLQAVVITFLMCSVALFHGYACIWYSMACEPVYMNKPAACQGRHIYHGDPFYVKTSVRNADPWEWYVGCLQWSIMTLRNAGNYYIPPISTSEFTTSVVFMTSGYLVTACILCLSFYIFGQTDMCRQVYGHEAHRVIHFVKHLRMKRHYTRSLYECFNSMWRNGVGYVDNVAHKLLPERLKINMTRSYFEIMVSNSELLNQLSPRERDAICLEAELQQYFKNEFIVRPNTLGNAVYFIVEGNVEIISYDNMQPILTLTGGSLIGEVNLVLAIYRKYGVKTSSMCSIIKLKSSSVAKILSLNPEARNRMHRIILKRLKWAKEFSDGASVLNKSIFNEVDAMGSENEPESISVSLKANENFNKSMTSTMIKKSSDIRLENLKYVTFFAWIYSEPSKLPKNVEFSNLMDMMHTNFRNNASIKSYKVFTGLKKSHSHFNWTISKSSTTYRLWNEFVITIIIFNTVFYPISLVMLNNRFVQPVNIFVDIIYTMDMLLRLIIFRSAKDISLPFTVHFFRKFQKIGTWIDIISAFPLYNVAILLQKQYDYKYLAMRFNVIIKFMKVVIIILQWENDVAVHTRAFRLFKHGTFLTFIIIIIACTMVHQRCGNNYLTCIFDNRTKWISFEPDRFHFDDRGQTIIEICFYWAMCVMSGIGFTDIAPQNREERTIHSVSLIIGLIFVVYFYSDLSSTFSAAVERKIVHQDNKIWVHDYLDEDHMNMKLIKRLDRFMDIQWLLLKGINTEQEVRTIGFLSISHSLHREFVLYLIAEVLYHSELSKLVNADAELIRHMSLAAKFAVVPPNEVLLASKDFVRRVYIIRRGLAEAYSVVHGAKLGILCKGHCIGFGEMVYQIPSRVKITTLTYLEVVIIDSSAFDKIAQESKAFNYIWKSLKYNENFKEKFQSAYRKLNHLYCCEKKKTHERERREFRPRTEVYIHGDIRNNENNSDGGDDDWHGCYKAFRCCRKYIVLWSFLPWTKLIKIWETVRVISIILVTLFLPLLEAFPYLKLKYMDYIKMADIITIFDMAIRFNLAYFEPRLKLLVTNPIRIAGHYLKTSFIIDFLAGPLVHYGIELAFELIDRPGWDTSIVAYLLRLNRMLLLYHLYQLYLYMDDKVSSGKTSWKLIKLLPLLFFHAHIMACILAVTSCPTKIPYPNPRCKGNTWISSSKTLSDPIVGGRSARNLTDRQIYVFGFYYSATTMVGCGFGDFLPANYSERCFTAILFYAYIFALGYLLATVAGSKCPLDYKILQHYQEMDYVMGYFVRENINSQTVGSALKYFDYVWDRTKGVEPEKVFNRMYPALKKEALTCMYEDLLSNVEVFRDFPQSVLRILCTHFVPVFCPEHTVVLRQGDMYDMFYLVKRGQLMFGVDGEWFKAVKKGEILGLDIMSDDKNSVISLYTIVTTSKTELLSIRMQDFYAVLDVFLTNILKEENDESSESEDELNLIEPFGNISSKTQSLIYQLLNISSSKWSKYKELAQTKASSDIRRDLKVKDLFQRFFERKLKAKQEGDFNPIISSDTEESSSSSSSDNLFMLNKKMQKPYEKPSSKSKYPLDEKLSTFGNQTQNTFLSVDIAEDSDIDDSIGGIQILPGVVTLSSEVGTDLYEQSKGNPKFSKGLITPRSIGVLLLDSSVLIAASLSVCLVCYQAAFKDTSISFIVLGYLCDVIYILKIIFSFCRRYVDNFGNPITAYTDIQTRYLGSVFGFTWDFISTFPLEILTPIPQSTVPDKMYFFCMLRLNRAIRLFDVWTYFRVKRSDSGFVIRNLLRRKLLRLFCYTIIYLHLITCILQAYTLLHCGSFKLSDPVQCLPTKHNISWVHSKTVTTQNYQDTPYIFTLYFIMSAFTTTAYGDVVPVTEFEMIYIAVVAISSKIWLGLALSDILSGLQNTTTVTYHLATRITLRLFDEKYQAPGYLLASAEEYLTYAWVRNRGVLIPECLNRIPICLKMDIFADAYGDHLRNNYLFRDLGECFIRQACLRLNHSYILPGDYLLYAGDIGSTLYFIHKGIVRYNQTFLDDDGLVVHDEGRISRYQCFGEENVMLGPYQYHRTYRAETLVETVCLTHSDVQELFALFPSHKKKVFRRLYSKTMAKAGGGAKETCANKSGGDKDKKEKKSEPSSISPHKDDVKTKSKNNLVNSDGYEINSKTGEGIE